MMKRLVFPVLVAILLVSCSANGAGTAQPTALNNWQDIPIMPDAVASSESMPVTGYQYTISTDMKSVEGFYLDEMKIAQWELLGKGDTSTQDFKGLALWFAKGEKIVTIDVWQKNSTTHVAIVPEP
jgi:hypothetical protein